MPSSGASEAKELSASAPHSGSIRDGGPAVRVLHILDPASCGDEGVLACAWAMLGSERAGEPGFEHDVWIVGDGAAERRAWSLGIASTDRISPRAGTCSRGTTGLLRRLREDRYPRAMPSIVQCWSLSALELARRVFGGGPGAPARVAVLARFPTPDEFPAAKKILAGASHSDLATGREVLAAIHPRVRASIGAMMGDAAEPDRWLHAVRLIDPPVPSLSQRPDASAIRAALEIDATEKVVGLLADPPSAADAHRFAFASGVVFAAGRPITVLIRRGATHERRGAAFIRAHSRRWGMVLADLSLPELVAASDVLFVDSPPNASHPSAGPTAIALAHAMVVPIVAFPGYFTPSDGPILLSPSESLGRIAVPIVELLESGATRAAQAAAARAWLNEAIARDGFRSTLHEVWYEVSHTPTKPDPAGALIS